MSKVRAIVPLILVVLAVSCVSVKPLARAHAEGAEIWSFRYDKCPNCGWHRAGYVAVRDCRIVYELETLDVM